MSQAELPAALRERCIAPADATTATDRAWQLVGLGAALGRIGESRQALRFLDAAVALGPRREVAAAAYATAVRLHWDAGDLETARKVNASRPLAS
jgi:tetratricopeptide (TPR) repeat protein